VNSLLPKIPKPTNIALQVKEIPSKVDVVCIHITSVIFIFIFFIVISAANCIGMCRVATRASAVR
jgi:hypothetical protein